MQVMNDRSELPKKPRPGGLRGRTGKIFLLMPIVISALTLIVHAATSLLTPEARRDLQLQPGVVFIEVRYNFNLFNYHGSCGSSGTGFLYRPDGYIVTNGHVVQFANAKDMVARSALADDVKRCAKDGLTNILNARSDMSAAQKHDVYEKLLEIIEAEPNRVIRAFEPPKVTVYLDNQNKYQGEIKAYSDPITEGGKDIAIIKIDGKNLPTVPIGDSDDLRVGDPLVVIGYPGAAEINGEPSLVPTVTNGKVSAVNKANSAGMPIIQSEAAISPGNSGGPAFDADGKVIGIATFKAREGEEINFFVPVNTAIEFIRQAGAEPKSGSFDDLWKQALDAYQSQQWGKAHTLMSGVLEMMPRQIDAMRLQQQAAANERTESGFDKTMETVHSFGNPALIGAGLIVVAILIGGAVLLLVRLKKPAVVVQAPSPFVSSSPTVVEVSRSLGSLQITTGPNKGRQYTIPQSGLRIGRDPEACTIVLPGDNVGREHAWVMPMENGSVAVIDRGSANGTFVNSFDSGRIRKVLLNNGDRILICQENSTEIVYHRN